jgi:hypothetical protein
MLSETIWGGGIVLEVLLLARGFRARLISRYPFFFAYSAAVLAMALLLIVPGLYDKLYWALQFLTLIIGYGILLEILNHVLAPYPGAEKFAKTSGLLAIAVIFCFALVFPHVRPQWSPGTSVEFERDLRTVQAIFISGLLAVVSYYGIVIGRNMKGMIVGYGLYIVTSLISLAVRAYAGASFTVIWRIVQPLSFDVSLVIWAVALWSYCPNPLPSPTIQLEADYEAFVSKTRKALGSVRGHLAKGARQP